MNDFNKEELQCISKLFKFEEMGIPEFEFDLWLKIEHMIDNYSEQKDE